MKINFIDLAAQRARLKTDMDARIAKVLDEGRYILGPEVQELEAKLAGIGKADYALTCANGTDAIILALLAIGVGPGDAVFCPSFTYCATAEAIARVGAKPVLVDIERDTYNMSDQSLQDAIASIKADGTLTPRAVVSVDLFGQSADYEKLAQTTKIHGLKLIADSAQAFGTTLNSHQPLHWADITTTSFYPAKPLGCYGDGGAVLTNDKNLADAIDSLRIHGKGTDKYDNVRVGLNSRLDTIQAAVLLAKLTIFSEELAARHEVAKRYCEALAPYVLRVPALLNSTTSTWAQFTIEVDNPDMFAEKLRAQGIPTARYYPKPIHAQTAYKNCPLPASGLPNTQEAMGKVISLPMHAYLSPDQQEMVTAACIDALKA